ncbi:MAG: hypothetical protein ACRCST_13865 [Turicibacter sp.]
MQIVRATKREARYFKQIDCLLHKTALIAIEEEQMIATLEYLVRDGGIAEIISFDLLKKGSSIELLNKFFEEIVYWNPYIKEVSYQNNLQIPKNQLKQSGFLRGEDTWIKTNENRVSVKKLNINDIHIEQLTVDQEKLNDVNSWIQKPEDIIITCVYFKNKPLCIDGYSRLVAAYQKGYEFVYGYFEEADENSMKFYETCLSWCKEQQITTVHDLTHHIVKPEEHQKLWIDRCQAYLNR